MNGTTEQVRNVPNPNGVGGFSEHPENINAGGRPQNSMKSYLARKLASMTDRQKEAFLKAHKVSGKDMIEFGEGKAKQDMDIHGEIVSKVVKLDE